MVRRVAWLALICACTQDFSVFEPDGSGPNDGSTDVTANDATDQTLMKHFGIFGPPTIAFYGKDGTERREFRVVGFMKAPEFASLANRAFQ